MIRDLSLSLQALLHGAGAEFPELAAAQIVFDRPAESFSPTQATIDMFLYDVRENMELRSSESIVKQVNGQTTLQRPPLRVACSYLVTAWPGNVTGDELALREHRLLSQVLLLLARYPTVPANILKGSLVGQEPPLPLITAQADGLKNPSEFWSALGNKMRPSLSLNVTVALQPNAAIQAAQVITSTLLVGERTTVDEQKLRLAGAQQVYRIGGRITDAALVPKVNVLVLRLGKGIFTHTDVDGQYSFEGVAKGTHPLRVQQGAATKDISITVPAPVGTNYDIQM